MAEIDLWVKIIVGVTTFAVVFFTKFVPWARNKLDRFTLQKRFGAELYPKGVIENSIRYYIQPDCQSLDPSGAEEPRLTLNPRENIFTVIDRTLNHPTEYRYIFLLGDTGMGKSSFLLNYYVRNLRRYRGQFKLVLLPLGIPDSDQRIEQIPEKENTVLFLDALDEDTLAIVDHTERIRNLVKLTRNFKKVLITCRTQFFSKDEEIPQETGLVIIGPIDAGKKSQYAFHKLYLSPLTDLQVEQYLKRRYSFWQFKRRNQVREMVRKIPFLNVRPMLLTYAEELNGERRSINYSFEIYEEMIEAWLKREEGRVENIKKELLRQFCEQLAIDLYINRERRGAERVHKNDLSRLAERWEIPLMDWQLSGRSLLNRDAVGNYKFAHRSMMEYLFVKRFLNGDAMCQGIPWTDQMQTFFLEILQDGFTREQKLSWKLCEADIIKIGKMDISVDRQMRTIFQEYSQIPEKEINRRMQYLPNIISNSICQFEEKKGGIIVKDYSTGLMWQQTTPEKITLENLNVYVAQSNREKLAGYSGWRLPTLEEIMPLIKANGFRDFNFDLIFEDRKAWIIVRRFLP